SNSIRTMKGMLLIPPLDVQMILQSPKNSDLAVCGGGPECALRIGQAAGADVVVFGTLAAIGESFNVNLRALRVRDGKDLGKQKADISGNRDLLIPEVRIASYRLLAPEQIRGALLVDVDVQGVSVLVDGVEAGVTPLKGPLEGLTPGAHTVLLKRPGFSPFQQSLLIKPFETTRLRLELGQATPAPATATAP
ncbi:MAG TPA: PEGA domain-containing protein, partial [Myxococcota bacterium]|nr:PEGA domain-containing protein [Myxococcota bacterium]